MRQLLLLACTGLLSACVATIQPSSSPAASLPTAPAPVQETAITPKPQGKPETTTEAKPEAKPELKPDSKAPSARYRQSHWAELPAWPGEQLLATWPAWLNSCHRINRRNGWQDVCAKAANLNPRSEAQVQTFFETEFQPWRIENSTGEGSGLVTGYYEPLIKGSLSYKPGRVPLYGVPDDMLTLDIVSLYPELKGQRLRGRLEGRSIKPYWSREEIDAGKAPLQDKVLAWADDPIEAFFMQVQGSGRVQLEDGRQLRLGYADQNGHPYRSIGRWLVEQGELTLEQASMQSISDWAQANPQRLRELLNANPSYVFFRTLPTSNGGPIGALNVGLTEGASIAVDPRFTPLGSPVYLATTRPNDSQPLNRLVQAQDTGGAIKGPVRADYFWGFGSDAGALAGKMKQPGQMWLLWPKGLELPAGQ